MQKLTPPRKFGVSSVGEVPWGTHYCQFYETKEDLIDILVPYFVEGLKSNEFCVWVTSDFLTKEEAIAEMNRAMPNFMSYLKKGQMEIFPYTEWYVKEGKFELQRVLNGWVEKHDFALSLGYDGARVSGNPFWIENKKDWDDFTEYEAEINRVIDNYKLLVLCTYSLQKCGSNEIIDVVQNHKCAMVKRSGKWSLIESSEHKRMENVLRNTEKKFSDLYSSMVEGVAFHQLDFDKKGNAIDYELTDVNPAFEKITGLTKDEVVGKKASKLYGTENPPYLDIYARVATTGIPESFETFFPPMGKHFSISCFSPTKGKFVTVFNDITHRKESEQKLEEYATRMEELAQEKAEQLRDAERLAAIGQTAAMVGHDIRNPLQAITSDVYLLKSDLTSMPDGKEKESIQESLEGINKNVDYINKIVSDLLDFSKPVQSKLEKINIETMIHEAMINVNIPQNINVKTTFITKPKTLESDPTLLKRILTNLINNAVQAMPNGGDLSVTVDQLGKALQISVNDTGKGIPEEIKTKIFKPLVTTKAKGQGFGLAAVKKLTEALGGKVTFESEEGKGAKFIVTF